MAQALTEDQVAEVISKAIGSAPSRRNKFLHFSEWRLSEKSSLRVEFAADILLIRRSPPATLKPGRAKGDRRFVIQLRDASATKKIVQAVKALW